MQVWCWGLATGCNAQLLNMHEVAYLDAELLTKSRYLCAWLCSIFADFMGFQNICHFLHQWLLSLMTRAVIRDSALTAVLLPGVADRERWSRGMQVMQWNVQNVQVCPQVNSVLTTPYEYPMMVLKTTWLRPPFTNSYLCPLQQRSAILIGSNIDVFYLELSHNCVIYLISYLIYIIDGVMLLILIPVGKYSVTGKVQWYGSHITVTACPVTTTGTLIVLFLTHNKRIWTWLKK